MSHPSTVILRADEVRQGEPRPLPLPGESGARPARARVLRQTPDGVLVEVVCGCGQRIQLQCRHDAGNAAADADAKPDAKANAEPDAQPPGQGEAEAEAQ
jgi:hypothetical protein